MPLRLSYQEEREWSVILEKTEKAEAHLHSLQAKTSEVLTSEESVALYRALGVIPFQSSPELQQSYACSLEIHPPTIVRKYSPL